MEGFEIASSTELSSECIDLTVCGENPLLLMAGGSLVLRSAADLSIIGEASPAPGNISAVQGFQSMVCAASDAGVITTFSVPEFKETAVSTVNGSVTFLSGAGSNLLFSSDEWTEVAVCSPYDLEIQAMYTFQESPVSSVSDSSLTVIYAVLPTAGIQVCRLSGEIAWKSADYGSETRMVISNDLETALFTRVQWWTYL